MVSAGTQSHHRALPSSTGLKRKTSSRPLFYGMIAAGAVFASVGFLGGALAVVQSLAHSAGGERARFETALALNPILRAEPGERNIRPEKFSRAPLPLADKIAASGLTQEAIRASRQRMAVVARLSGDRETSVKAHGLTADAIRAFQTRTTAVASIAPAKAKTSVTAVAALHAGKDEALFAAAAKVSMPSGLASALVDPNAAQDDAMPKPFSLVLAEREAGGEMAGLPESVPLPIARPEALVRKPADAKPVRELAYAKPQSILEDDDDSGKPIVPTVPRRRGGKIAYYDISAGVVHMPSGEKLEAHSGIGEMRDNPKFTHVKMRGPTPPGTYRMSMRESLFHGVAAIRLTPTSGVAPKGRTGLLAHSYLLKRRGDSHGCVAFADYNRFLRAFQRGEVDTMIIVEKMSAWGGMTASADDGKKGFWPWQRRSR